MLPTQELSESNVIVQYDLSAGQLIPVRPEGKVR